MLRIEACGIDNVRSIAAREGRYFATHSQAWNRIIYRSIS